jgi:translation initiation factor IF-1
VTTKKGDSISVEGVVVKVFPGAHFEVELEGGRKIRAHISGRMRMNFVRIMVGDKVTVELNPYDLAKGRVVFRHK